MSGLLEPFKKPIHEVQEYLRLLGQVARGLITRPIYARDIIEQCDAIGIGSLMVVILTGIFTGMVLALQAGITLDRFGVRSTVGSLVSASMVKELGPVLTALIVAGRVGSGIAAELGSMMVTDQIAALRALGTDPVRKLVVPRVVAGTLMLPVLTVLAIAVGMLGGAIISATQLKVATSVFVIESSAVVPGKVPAPVLQLFSVPLASQKPLVGAAFQLPLAACDNCEPSGDNPTVTVARPRTRNLRRTVSRVGGA